MRVQRSLSLMDKSAAMGRVRSKDTKPELLTRRILAGLKVRYRLHPALPGKPDLYVGRLRTAIFVHGCFWHQHHCKRAAAPHSNIEFWTKKLNGNAARDVKVRQRLEECGVRIIYLWTCELHLFPAILKAMSDEYHASKST